MGGVGPWALHNGFRNLKFGMIVTINKIRIKYDVISKIEKMPSYFEEVCEIEFPTKISFNFCSSIVFECLLGSAQLRSRWLWNDYALGMCKPYC